jgi:hypothetical protein
VIRNDDDGVDERPKRRSRKPSAKDIGNTPYDFVSSLEFDVVLGGRPQKLSAAEALEQKTLEDAFALKVPAIRDVLQMTEKRQSLRSPAQKRTFAKTRFENPDPENVDNAALILGIAAEVPGRQREDGERYLEVEPWAVRAGLARLKRTLTPKVISELKGFIRDPDTIVWPEENNHDR